MKGSDSLILVDTCGDHRDQEWIRKVPASTFCTTEVRQKYIICQHIYHQSLSITNFKNFHNWIESKKSGILCGSDIWNTYYLCNIFWFLIERGFRKCMKGRIFPHSFRTIVIGGTCRDKKGWTQRVGLANVSPKGLYHVMRGWIKLDSGR